MQTNFDIRHIQRLHGLIVRRAVLKFERHIAAEIKVIERNGQRKAAAPRKLVCKQPCRCGFSGRARPGEHHKAIARQIGNGIRNGCHFIGIRALAGCDEALRVGGNVLVDLLNSSKQVIETKSCTASGEVTFSTRTYTDAANETYYIREKVPATEDPDMQSYDRTEYRVSVVVTKSRLILTPNVPYYKNDHTHTSRLGAERNAKSFAEGLRKMGHPLAKYLK